MALREHQNLAQQPKVASWQSTVKSAIIYGPLAFSPALHMRLLTTALLISSLSLFAACSSPESDTATIAPAGAPGKKVDPATAGSVSGRVEFTGAVPPADPVPMNADRKCVVADAPNPVSDALLVGSDHSVRNAFVYVKEGLDPGYTFDPPAGPMVMDQKGCLYTPRVFGVRVGQSVEIVNSDDTMHNVHALPMANQEFNQSLMKKASKMSKVFTVPEVMVRFKCDVHGWMAAWVGVVAHPFFAVTDETGAFSLKGLPPGDYTLEAWHEKLGTQSMKVTVAPSQAQNASFTFSTIK